MMEDIQAIEGRWNLPTAFEKQIAAGETEVVKGDLSHADFRGVRIVMAADDGHIIEEIEVAGQPQLGSGPLKAADCVAPGMDFDLDPTTKEDPRVVMRVTNPGTESQVFRAAIIGSVPRGSRQLHRPEESELVMRDPPETVHRHDKRWISLDLAAIDLKGSLEDGDPVRFVDMISDGHSPPFIVLETDNLAHRFRVELIVVGRTIIGDFPPQGASIGLTMSAKVVPSEEPD